jgi:hypothetical protein
MAFVQFGVEHLAVLALGLVVMVVSVWLVVVVSTRNRIAETWLKARRPTVTSAAMFFSIVSRWIVWMRVDDRCRETEPAWLALWHLGVLSTSGWRWYEGDHLTKARQGS